MFHRIVVAVLLGGALAAPAAAQQVPVVQAGADGRYETQLDGKKAVYGRSAGEVAAFRAGVDRLVAVFAAMPEVTSPPSPVCHRLKSWIEVQSPHGAMAGEVGVMAPISFENGRCHAMTGTGVIARLNSLSLLYDPQQAFVRMDRGPSDWFLLPKGAVDGPIIRLDETLAFTHGRAPLLRPVSAERYLNEMLRRAPVDPVGGGAGELARWLAEDKPKMLAENAQMLRELAASMKPADLAKVAEAQRVVVNETEASLRHAARTDRGPSDRQRLETQLSALDGAARAAPACIQAGTGALDPTSGCPAGLTLVELNPDYFDKSRPEAVQLLVIETPRARTHGESDERLAARRAVWNALDLRALASLVR